MFLFQYLDQLPKIPEELLVDLLPDQTRDNIGFQDAGPGRSFVYTRWSIQEKLKQWLAINICEDVRLAGVQTITWAETHSTQPNDLTPHCDRRQWALNYLIDTGGPNTATHFYLEAGKPLLRTPSLKITDCSNCQSIYSKVIEAQRWHILNTNVLHGVVGAISTRMAVTVGINGENPFSKITGYKQFY